VTVNHQIQAESGRLGYTEMPGAAVAAMRAFGACDYRERLGTVSQKVLVIMEERDRTLPIEMGLSCAMRLPGRKLCVLPGCAHAAHLERPGLFDIEMRDFLVGH